MQINIATLCDFAQVRAGLLFICSAGITRVGRPSFPNDMGTCLAVSLEVPSANLSDPFEVRVTVEDEDGKVAFQQVGGLQIEADHGPGDTIQVPLVFDLSEVVLPAQGRYMVRIALPAFPGAEKQLSFRAELATPQGHLPGM